MNLALEIKRIFADGSPARYNVAAWQKTEEDHVVLVGREVHAPGTFDSPDVGRLVLFEINDENQIVHERVLWEPIHSSFFLEDPRALVLPSGHITIGLTAVLRAEKGYSPFPAVVQIKSTAQWTGELPPISLIHTYGPGKNLTPIKENLFLFRPEQPEYHHRLLFFDIHNMASSTYDIEFPIGLKWAVWRIGTTMPPLWVNDEEALLIIHGITVENGKFVYSIGRARLFKRLGRYMVQVHADPFITPETFLREGKPMEEELHPELRRVVYACGGVIKRKDPDNLFLYVNVGDRTTYEVKVSLNDLKRGLF